MAVLDSYRFGLSQSLLGATTFVKTLRSPHAFLMDGGLPCKLRMAHGIVRGPQLIRDHGVLSSSGLSVGG
jgi:hypothetical protein